MSQCVMCRHMYRLGVTGASAAQSHTSAHTQYIDLPLHVMFFQISQNQVLRLEGIITEQFAAIAFAHSVIPDRIVSLVVVLLVCNRSTLAFPDFSRCRFDELSPCLGVFESFWVCACEMRYKLEPLSLPGFQLIFGRGLAQLVPSLSCDLNFDLGCSSLAISGSAPFGHRDGHGAMSRWATMNDPNGLFDQEVQDCNSGVSKTQSAFVETPCFDTKFMVD